MEQRQTVSFDIFDTLITRKTIMPTGIFSLMQKKIRDSVTGLPDLFYDRFYDIRVNAEIEARKIAKISNDTSEVSLNQIYETMAVQNGLDDSDMYRLISLEIDTERENILPITENIQKIKEIDANTQILLISDMYLSKEQIRMLLTEVDSFFNRDIPIIVSNEHNASKAEGSLYKYCIEKYGIDKEKWTHIGDNEFSDVVMAEAYGAKTVWYKALERDGFGIALAKRNPQNASLQLVVRITNDIESDSLPMELGIKVGGPILYGYVNWVISMALSRRTKRLYFIARDGYVLKRIADIIIKKNRLEIETYYLYGSRVAWRMPSWAKSSEMFESKCRVYCELTPTDEMLKILSETGKEIDIPFIKAKATGTVQSDRFIKRYLMNNSKFLDSLFLFYKGRRQRVVNYLKQEIGSYDDSIAFVDLNGTGQTHRCVSQIMSDFFSGTVDSYYFSLSCNENINYGSNRFMKFMHKRFSNEDLIETLCRAPHGQTVDYIFDGQQWKPVLDSESNQAFESQYEEYVRGVIRFTELMPEQDSTDKSELYYISEQYYSYICDSPDREFVDFIGDIPFESENANHIIHNYAPHLTEEQMKQIFLFGREPLTYLGIAPSSWQVMQMRMTDSEKEQCARYKKMSRKLPEVKNETAATSSTDIFTGSFVIYGAGEWGRQVHDAISRCPDARIIGWVDRDAATYRKKGLPVDVVEDIRHMEFDFVIIAIKNGRIVQGVREMLHDYGIKDERII